MNFCPGSGATFGNAVVAHPKTRFIAFTGSKEVGLDIHERAAKAQPGQIWIKRTILEMGGKDSIVVSADADFDAAVDGVVAAAFGFSGQKCSACSRAIVEEAIYTEFIDRLRERAEKLTVGDPATNPNMGPVVNEGAMRTILDYIEIGKKEGRLLAGGKAIETPEKGYYVAPTVIADVAPDARICAGRDFRAGAGGDPGAGFRSCAGDCEQHGVRADGRGVLHGPSEAGSGAARVPRGESVLEPEVHGGDGGGASVWRVQHVGTDSKAGGPDYLYLFTQAKSVGGEADAEGADAEGDLKRERRRCRVAAAPSKQHRSGKRNYKLRGPAGSGRRRPEPLRRACGDGW